MAESNVQLHYLVVNTDLGVRTFMSDFDFASYIRQKRAELGWGQEEAAKKTGLTYGTYGRIERGEVKPKLEQVTRIFTAFGLSLGELTDEEQEQKVLSARDWLNKMEICLAELRRLLGQ